MKIVKYMIALLMSFTLFNACNFEDDLNIDPNKPSTPDTKFLFLMAETYTTNYAWNDNYNPWVQIYPQYIAELKNIQFTKFAITDYSTSSTYSIAMNNLNEIIKLNKDESRKSESWVSSLGDSNNQIAAAMTLKAFFMMHLTDIVGALPYSEALKGTENFTPKFDTQKEIYTTLFKELKEAYTLFNTSGSLDGTYDILYGGNIEQWKKFNASIRMMMAIKLQKADANLGKIEFAKAYKDGGITENTDNLIYKYLSENDNENPLYNNMFRSGRQDFSPSSTIIDILKKYNDPRLKEYAAPNKDGEYIGATFGWTGDEASHSGGLEAVSAFNDKYYAKQNTPITIISASQVLLMATEAAQIGWISESVETLYKKGITTSFEQHGIASSELEAYIKGNEVALTGSNNIEKIAMQKWIANYMQDGVEAWSDWRRLQVPKLTPGTVGSTSVTHIPYRLRYASSDIISNKKNYDEAIVNQGADDTSTKLWWNK